LASFARSQTNLQTPGTITFVAVGEEGLGDLRGQALFKETLAGEIDRFVSIEGGVSA
jgi:hypothetical protein